jgi:hypothetical protein
VHPATAPIPGTALEDTPSIRGTTLRHCAISRGILPAIGDRLLGAITRTTAKITAMASIAHGMALTDTFFPAAVANRGSVSVLAQSADGDMVYLSEIDRTPSKRAWGPSGGSAAEGEPLSDERDNAETGCGLRAESTPGG